VVVYLDDILTYSRTRAEHLAHIRTILTLLRKIGPYVKSEKFTFMRKNTEFISQVGTRKRIHNNISLAKYDQLAFASFETHFENLKHGTKR
ncbi:hypothetical protein BGZ99_007683, partial [Dissophora globulifera]